MARVLLVEDDRWQAECYALWLTQAGHDVQVVHDAQSALDALDDESPHVLVLDILLPHANGVQLLHQMRSYTDMSSMAVVLCSSTQPPANVDLAAYGVAAVLDKTTLTPQLLRQTVARYAAT